MKKITWFITIVFVGLILWAFYSYATGPGFLVRDVRLSIEVPEEVSSGEELTLPIVYENRTKATLRQVELVVWEGDDRSTQLLDDIPPGAEVTFDYALILLGQVGDSREVSATLHYRPDDFDTQFEARAKEKLEITSAAVRLAWDLPETVSAGSLFDGTITILYESDKPLLGAVLELIWPDDFTLTKGARTHHLGDLQSGSIKTISLAGALGGEEVSSTYSFVARLSEVAEAVTEIEVVGSPLVLSAQTSSRFIPGEVVEYKLLFENQSSRDLTEAVIEVLLEGDGFELEEVDVERGSFDPFQEKITWTSLSVPLLAKIEAGQSGEVMFSVPIKRSLLINSFTDKNFSVRVSGTIFTQQRLGSSFTTEQRLASRVEFSAKGFFQDTSSSLDNSGPLPPRVGQDTTYTIHWQLVNGANDVEDLLVSASLPAGVSWASRSEVSQGGLSYNNEANQILWEVDTVPAHAGSLLPTYEAVFQVRLTPTNNQVGRIVPILNESILSVRDTFTEETLTARSATIVTDLPDDPTVSMIEGKVIR